ncbi:hypothetical protein BKA56DRAFT_620480 [Ilyonectria sp. MPI-CAGE-AT-0026]|nr:hypothetical protein BKA56DRAFT_620480 [Ilyonectria sp. MPI-CAGE-AT-0026]
MARKNLVGRCSSLEERKSVWAYLTMQTFLHITGTKSECNSLQGLVLTYDLYSWSFLPSNYKMRDTVYDSLEREFGSLADHGSPYDYDLKHPEASLMYRRLDDIRACLPPALFLCGNAHPMLDNTILMSARWQLAEGSATVKLVAGTPQAFVEMPIESGDCCIQAAEIIQQFLQDRE